MASFMREVLTADQMRLSLFTGGQSKVGIGVSGTWTGTVNFRASPDGLNFRPVTMTPFASGTGVQSTTVNGNWEAIASNYVAFGVQFTRLTGSAIITMAASVDSSYQDAFLASSSKYVNSTATNATNTLTQAAQANRAWRLRTLVVSVLGGAVTWAASPALAIKDGSTILWAFDLPTTNGAQYTIPLPADTPYSPGGGIVNTPGNAMSIVCAAGGAGVITNINAEFAAA